MRLASIFRQRLRSLFSRKNVEQELDEELRYHLERQIDAGLAAGLPRENARYAALQSIKDIEQRKEECRDMRQVNLIDNLLQDFRYAARNLRKNPGFALVAGIIMALGIGANTAMFSIVNSVLLKPLSYRDPDRIVTLSTSWKKGGGAGSLWKNVSVPNFEDWHNQATAFEAMAYYSSQETSVSSGSAAEYARATRVSPEFFRVFEVEPMLGRPFTSDEVRPRSGGAALISYTYWQSHFGGDARALGHIIRMFGKTLAIVGILPPGFHFPDKTDVWFPADTIVHETTEYRSANNYQAVGRLKAAVSLEQAQAQMTSIAARLEQQYPENNKGTSVSVTRMRDEMVGDVRLTLFVLLGAVGVVLLIACANTATLLLAKATARTREVGVRAALGATRARIVRQLITESLLLALLAGACGLILALGGSKALIALAPGNVPRLAETSIDGWVLTFTLGVSAITSLLFGLVPALHASHVDLNDVLKQGATRSVLGGRALRMRGALVTAEIALSVVLLTGAGLLIKSFVALHDVALGFRPENVLVMKASVPISTAEGVEGWKPANAFFKGVLTDISTLPGVLAAGATMATPGDLGSTIVYWIDHMPRKLNTNGPAAVLSVMAPGTFAALGIPLKSGRDFNDADTRDAPFVAVVNEALARKSFHGENPLGRTIFCPFDSDNGMKIIGVAGDVRQSGPAREPMPECIVPYTQHFYNGTTLNVVVRTAMNPDALAGTLRRIARERSSDVPVKFTTMEASLSENVAAPRFRTVLLGVFAGLAICLAMAGVYSVLAYVVSQRSNEIGLRMALGASPGDVLQLILRQGLVVTGVGLALGLIGAVATARLLTSMLFEVKPIDPAVYVSVAVLLVSVTLAASYIPARRAAKLDPLVALRQE
ncbi:MAG: ABC transporter permease [Bryobacteraceae bacterium]